MSIKRWAVRRDENEPEIVEALRAAGCTVGYGDWVDLIVGRTLPNGEKRTYLLEVKDGDKPKSGRKLKPSQEKLLAEWKGHYTVVLNVDQALEAVGVTTSPMSKLHNPEDWVKSADGWPSLLGKKFTEEGFRKP